MRRSPPSQMPIQHLCRIIVLLLVVVISGCGGGGGDSGGLDYTNQVTYNGITTNAVINASSAKPLVASVFSSDLTNNVALKGSDTTADISSITFHKIFKSISEPTALPLPQRRGTYSARISVNETLPCDSGQTTISGELTDQGTGDLDLSFQHCSTDGVVVNGNVAWKISSYDILNDVVTNSTYRFPVLTVSDAGGSVRVGGSFKVEISLPDKSERVTNNLVLLNQSDGLTLKTESLVYVYIYDNIYYPTTHTETVNGRVYHSKYGFVDIQTTTPFVYASTSDTYPSQGEARLLGSNSSSVSVTALPNDNILLSLDSDGDAIEERWVRLQWPDLTVTSDTNNIPTANPGTNRSIRVNIPELLDGTLSSDPEYDFLSYHWRLESAPSGSQAVLSSDFTSTTSIVPDMQGDYTVSLYVQDGELTSEVKTIVLRTVMGNFAADMQSWGTYQGNSLHNGYVPLSLDPSLFSVRWTKSFPQYTQLNNIVAGDERVFASTSTSSSYETLYVLDARNGASDWEYTFNSTQTAYPPAYNSGTVWVQTLDRNSVGHLWAFNAESQSLIYDKPTGYLSAQWPKSPTPLNGSLYLVESDGTASNLKAIDGLTGNTTWSVALSERRYSTPSLNDTDIFVFDEIDSANVSVFDIDTGATNYQMTDQYEDGGVSSMGSAPVIGGWNDLISTRYGWLICFDLDAQAKKWEISNRFSGQPAVANGVIYVASDSHIEARDEWNGDLLWEWPSDSGFNISSNLIVTDNLLFVADYQTTYAIDLDTHMTVWSYPLSGGLALSDEGALFINTGDGQLAAIDVEGDIDADGVPGWWERKYKYNPSSATDATVDDDGDGLTTIQEYNARTDPAVSDTDGDGLSDGVEVLTEGTNPRLADTDGDGLNDADEVNIHLSSPLLTDTDGDGLSDGAEVLQYGTDPTNPDTDGDSITDIWEIENGLDPLVASGTDDPDNDGLINLNEFIHLTDPNNPDTDGDGLIDGIEINIASTDPLEEDSDSDRIPDGWEYDNSLNPLLASDAVLDADTDGFINRSEYFSATDPQDTNSYPLVPIWSMYQGTSEHTGYVPLILDPALFEERWKTTIQGNPSLNPAVAADGNIMVTTESGGKELFVMDARLGSFDWQISYDDQWYTEPPAYDSGMLYFRTGIQTIGINLISRQSLFALVDDGFLYKSFSPTPYGGNLYYSPGMSGIKSINATTGVEQWRTSLNQNSVLTPTIKGSEIYVYAGNVEASLFVYDLNTGNEKFSIPDNNYVARNESVSGAAVIGSRRNIIVRQLERLISFDLSKRTINWEIDGGFSGQPSLANGLIYSPTTSGVNVIDERSGVSQWQWTPDAVQITSNLIITETVMFAGSADTTYAIDLNTHQVVWTYPAGGHLSLSDEGALIITSMDGQVIAIEVEGDVDADGVAGWWERKHNYDPSNPGDALLDDDADGLTTLQEYANRSDPADSDTDDDGINDGDEVNIHTSNPANADTDGDGFNDGDEINIHMTSPIEPDSDFDGLSDWLEITVHTTDPNLVDTDSDGIHDGWEVDNGLNPLMNDSSADPDTDDLSHLEEFTAGTDPDNPDSDDDGLTDGEEVKTTSTDPLNEDSDSDRMIDGWEYIYSLDPLSPLDAQTDPDADEFTNVSEYYSDTNPQNANHHPLVTQWKTYQGNAGHTGYVPLILDATKFSQRWVKSFTNNPSLHPVTAGDGKVFVTTSSSFSEGILFVVNALTGDTEWQHSFGNLYSMNPPAYDNGLIYLQNNIGLNSYFYAFNAQSQQQAFRTPYSDQHFRHMAPTPYDGHIYTPGGTYNGIQSFDGAQGQIEWQVRLNHCDRFTASVNQSFVMVYTGADDGDLTVINRSTGDIEFKIIDQNFISTGLAIDMTPAIGSRNNLIAVQHNRLISFDLTNRSIGWEFSNNYAGQPSLTKGDIYVISDGGVEAHDEISGAWLWEWTPINDSITNNLVITEKLLFASSADTTYAVDLSTHETVWTYAAGGNLAISDEDALYISTDDGRLIAIDLGTQP